MTPPGGESPAVFNVARHFLEGNLAAGRGEAAAFHHAAGTLSHDEVLHAVRRAAGVLRGLGVEREHRVALLLPDSPELIAGFWGVVWAGAVAVPINVRSTPADVRFIVADSRARLLVTTRAWRDRLGALGTSGPRLLLADEPPLRSRLPSTGEMAEAAPTSPDEPAFWLYTSGSTGRPKGVVHVHRAMVGAAESYARATLGLSAGDLSYSVAKIPFAYGLGNTLYMPAAVGGAAVLADAADVFEVIADVARYRPTVFCAMPSTYAQMLAVADEAPLPTASLRLAVSAAEPLPASIWHAFRARYGLEICEGIGTTEMLHIFVSNRPGACRPGSTGRPVPGYEVRVLDAAGQPVPAGETGTLEVAGPTLMAGYWNRYESSREVMHGRALRTRDRYVVAADGFFHFVGRADDLLKIRGQWVSPLEVEAVVGQHPAVVGCAVSPARSADDLVSGLVAFVELAPGRAVDDPALAADIRGFARQRLPHFKAPGVVRLVEALPRTATGKIDRRQLEGVTHEHIRS